MTSHGRGLVRRVARRLAHKRRYPVHPARSTRTRARVTPTTGTSRLAAPLSDITNKTPARGAPEPCQSRLSVSRPSALPRDSYCCIVQQQAPQRLRGGQSSRRRPSPPPVRSVTLRPGTRHAPHAAPAFRLHSTPCVALRPGRYGIKDPNEHQGMDGLTLSRKVNLTEGSIHTEEAQIYIRGGGSKGVCLHSQRRLRRTTPTVPTVSERVPS